jgi:hypothetical protein
MNRKLTVSLGIGLVIALFAFGLSKPHRWDMMWGCHLATLAIAVGCIANRKSIVFVGLLFHLGMGFGMWALDAATSSGFQLASVLMHVSPVAVAIVATRRVQVPWRAVTGVGVFCMTSVALCRLITPRALNINLAFAASPLMASALPTQWMQLLVGTMFACLCAAMSRYIINVIRFRKATS